MFRKRLLVILSIVLILLISSCTTSDKLYFTPLYEVKTRVIPNIAGDIKVDEMIIHKDVGIGKGNNFITLSSLERSDTKTFLFYVDYTGGYWKFIEKLQLKIDGELFTLTDDDPSRLVLNGGVEERAGFILSKGIIEKLKNSSSLVLQYYVDPFTMDAEAISEIKKFLSM
ncbi:MAG: hypothetical protein EOM67_15185 [Spirochaetia bacterium]|nr:hypothetical protein [Spirochaetia bacterium]